MSVQVITSLEGLERIAPEWREFDSAAPVPLPFRTADWTLSWWRHLAESRSAVRDRMFTVAVREASGRLAGVAPLMITERPAIGPLRGKCLQYIGADPNITEVRTLSARPGLEDLVYREVVQQVADSRGEWDWARWTGVPAEGPGPALLDSLGAEWPLELPCWLLDLAPTWEEFKSGLSRNIKESLRKCANAPKRDGLNFEFEVTTGDKLMPSLDRFLELHTRRSELKGTVDHANVFAGAAAQAFLREACERLSQRGAAHVFELRLAGATIASRIGFRFGRSMYLYFSGYDPAYAKYSVMTTCVANALRWSIEAGIRTANLSTGTDVSKTRWGARAHVFREARLVSPGIKSRVSYAAFSWARHRLRGALQALGRRR